MRCPPACRLGFVSRAAQGSKARVVAVAPGWGYADDGSRRADKLGNEDSGADPCLASPADVQLLARRAMIIIFIFQRMYKWLQDRHRGVGVVVAAFAHVVRVPPFALARSSVQGRVYVASGLLQCLASSFEESLDCGSSSP